MTIARSLASCSLIVLSAGIVLAQPVSFLAPVNVFVSGSSRGANMCQACVAIADFNGDGKPDIAYAGNELLPFSGVVLGNGDGTFRPAVTFPWTMRVLPIPSMRPISMATANPTLSTPQARSYGLHWVTETAHSRRRSA
jgi:hypothetical protein